MNKIILPRIKQKYDWSCGTAAMRTLLIQKHIHIPEDHLIYLAKATKKDGTSVKGLLHIADIFGLDYSVGENMSINDLVYNLSRDNLVVMPIQALAKYTVKDWSSEWESGHYIIALDYEDGKIIFQDPGVGHRRSLSYDKLDVRWHDKDDVRIYNHFGIIFSGRLK